MSDTNYWLDDECAQAFWDQHKALPYQELLRDTANWMEPQPGQRWLDLGCGGGHLSATLWHTSQGQLGEIVAVDCAAINERAIGKLRLKLKPTPQPEQFRFVQGNFSDGLPQFPDNYFDGIVSGLAISYAESRDPVTGRYNDRAYMHLLAEMFRVLKPGGRLLFSINVPRPRFWRIFWKSLGTAFKISKPGKVLVNVLKMQSYGHWLNREARRGRFHFYPIQEIECRLQHTGYDNFKYRLSYADQAYVILAKKPVAAAVAA